jgi:hypothetical protein
VVRGFSAHVSPPSSVTGNLREGEAMKTKKPPIGVIPRYLWDERHPNPTVEELRERFAEVSNAIRRYRDAGLQPNALWLAECKEKPETWRDRPPLL